MGKELSRKYHIFFWQGYAEEPVHISALLKICLLSFSQQYDKNLLMCQDESLGVRIGKSETGSFGWRTLEFPVHYFPWVVHKESLDVTIATISFPNGKLGQGAALGWGICLWCKGDTFHNVFCWKVYTSAGPTLGNTGKWFFSNICLYWNHSSSLLPLPRGVIL